MELSLKVYIKKLIMADNAKQNDFSSPLKRIFRVIQLEKNEISSVYFYAILNGLIQLSLPLGLHYHFTGGAYHFCRVRCLFEWDVAS